MRTKLFNLKKKTNPTNDNPVIYKTQLIQIKIFKKLKYQSSDILSVT